MPEETPEETPPISRPSKMIRFGPDFDEWEDDRKIRYLKALASSMNEAADTIQKERNALLVVVAQQKEQLANANKKIELQKLMLDQSIAEHNEERNSLGVRINELVQENKKLKQEVKDLKEAEATD